LAKNIINSNKVSLVLQQGYDTIHIGLLHINVPSI